MTPINWSTVDVAPPVHYTKGECKTNTFPLAQTNRESALGSGGYGRVFSHRTNPELAVKKSYQSMEMEYLIGKKLNHKNLLKSHALFIKHRSAQNFTQKLVMDRIQGHSTILSYGSHSQQYIPRENAASLLQQALDVCLYLFDQNIYWWDIGGCNAYISNDAQHLLLADFGCWGEELDPSLRGYLLLSDLQTLVSSILQAAGFSKDEISQLTPHIDFPNCHKCNSQDAKNQFQNHSHHFTGKTNAEIKKFISDYVMSIKDKLPPPQKTQNIPGGSQGLVNSKTDPQKTETSRSTQNSSQLPIYLDTLSPTGNKIVNGGCGIITALTAIEVLGGIGIGIAALASKAIALSIVALLAATPVGWIIAAAVITAIFLAVSIYFIVKCVQHYHTHKHTAPLTPNSSATQLTPIPPTPKRVPGKECTFIVRSPDQLKSALTMFLEGKTGHSILNLQYGDLHTVLSFEEGTLKVTGKELRLPLDGCLQLSDLIPLVKETLSHKGYEVQKGTETLSDDRGFFSCLFHQREVDHIPN